MGNNCQRIGTLLSGILNIKSLYGKTVGGSNDTGPEHQTPAKLNIRMFIDVSELIPLVFSTKKWGLSC